MHRDPKNNFDHAPLEADHTNALKHHGPNDADRLLHRRCNRQRLDGRDDRRPNGPETGPDSGRPRFDWTGIC
ncbi:hypothetical protein [Corynebacterium sp.]|uniref:hypothetical protein n=1 Tax=Corynebacterium sp. TaxID=1720 RepID=UPI0025BDDEC2|nr:hypothetical protein [Corynebacterium sp.]